MPPGSGNTLLLPLPICSRTSSIDTSLATAPGAGQPGRPALLEEPLRTPDATASRDAKDYLCFSAMALCSLGVPLTPQSPFSLPGSLTRFLLWTCLKIISILFFVLYKLLLKKICFGQSYGLHFLASGY